MGPGGSSAAKPLMWRPARGGGHNTRATGGGPVASAGNEDWPMRPNVVVESGAGAEVFNVGRKSDVFLVTNVAS